MPARTIKQEIIRPAPAKSATSAGSGTTTNLRNGTGGEGPSSGTQSAPDRRHVRSHAPSVDTHAAHQIFRVDDDSDDDGPVLREVRPRVKSPQGETEDVMARLRNEPPQNASFVSRGFTAIGDKIKALNDTLGELQALGIHHDTGSLPELVLVGDQSAGKSSLMSAFSGIYLPRSEGVCTRCPVHIRLSQKPAWSCKISLQQDYDYRPPVGRRVTARDVTKNNPFGPWFSQARSNKDFAILTDTDDPSEVEQAIRWAQIANLNHNKPYELYRPQTGEIWKRFRNKLDEAESNTEASFSPNTVALEVSGPDLADLSFYDLPGVFKNARQEEDQYLVQVVENLAGKYISHTQAIILWAVPMNADPETSSTFSIIRGKGAQSRTVGIMTKADLLPPGSHNQWLAMLRGAQHRVGHGYFITARPLVTRDQFSDEQVRQRSQAVGETVDELLRQGAFEEGFFNRSLDGSFSQQWPERFNDFKNRCGISHLSVFLSQQLGEEFARSLPEIKEKISEKLLEVNYSLLELPELPANPEIEVRRSVLDFETKLKASLQSTALSSEWGQVAKKFRQEILSLKPRFVVMPDTPHRTDAQGRIDLTRDDDTTISTRSFPATPQMRRRRLDDFLESQINISPAVKRLCPADNGIKDEIRAEGSLFAIPRRATGHGLGATPQPHLVKLTSKKKLADIRRIIEAMSTPGMPGLVPDEVYNSLCMEAVEPWRSPLGLLVDRTYHVLDAKINEILEESLSSLKGRLVFKNTASIMRKLLVDQLTALKETLLKLYRVETRKFYTLDKDLFTRHEAAEAKLINRHRHHYRWLAHLGDKAPEETKLKPWEDMNDEERTQEEVRMNKEAAKLGPDPYRVELGVCAYVRGYYLTATTRFVDTTTLHIISGLIPDIVEEIDHLYVDRHLGLVGVLDPAFFYLLMDEDQETSDKRKALQEDRTRFENAIKSIEKLEDRSPTTNGGAQIPTSSSQLSHGVNHNNQQDVEMDVEY